MYFKNHRDFLNLTKHEVYLENKEDFRYAIPISGIEARVVYRFVYFPDIKGEFEAKTLKYNGVKFNELDPSKIDKIRETHYKYIIVSHLVALYDLAELKRVLFADYNITFDYIMPIVLTQDSMYRTDVTDKKSEYPDTITIFKFLPIIEA